MLVADRVLQASTLGYFDGYADDEATYVTNMTAAHTDDTFTIKGGKGRREMKSDWR